MREIFVCVRVVLRTREALPWLNATTEVGYLSAGAVVVPCLLYHSAAHVQGKYTFDGFSAFVLNHYAFMFIIDCLYFNLKRDEGCGSGCKEGGGGGEAAERGYYKPD